MPGFANIQQLVGAEENGQVRYSTWRKTPTQTTVAGIWFDLSMSPGNPIPQYYASSPNVAARLTSADGGIYHGQPVAPATKHLKTLTAMTLTATVPPCPMILCDYLLYYPFVDMGTTDTQAMDNTVTLSRYTNGVGVKIMPVVVAGQVGGVSFNVTYTNQDGVGGRVTPTILCNSQIATGTVISTSATNTLNSVGPFLPLRHPDTGVRKIDSVTFLGIDVGLVTFVLVKPIVNMTIRGVDAPVERVFWKEFFSLVPVVDNAYLNFLCCPNGTLNGAPIFGDATFVWSA
jgi:hypothetical protein